MTGPDVMERIHEAAVQCAERGKTARSIFLGTDALAAIVAHMETSLRWLPPDRSLELAGLPPDPIGPRTFTIHTCAGGAEVRHRRSLHQSVIVEAEDGEPFIVEGPQ